MSRLSHCFASDEEDFLGGIDGLLEVTRLRPYSCDRGPVSFADLDLPVAVTTLGEGAGPPVIVLPGGPCRGPEYLGDLAGLGETRQLILMHPRGTPKSGGLSRGWWTDANDVILVADALGLQSVDLVAHSAGTRLALATATQFTSRVRSMALITPPASWLTDMPSDAESIAEKYCALEAREALAFVLTDEPSTELEFHEAFQRQAPASYAHWTAVEQSHAKSGAVSLVAAAAWFADIPPDAGDRIRATPQPPTLVVAGDRDLLTGVKPVAGYASLLGADYALIEECGHYPWVEQPQAFRGRLDAWLNRDV